MWEGISAPAASASAVPLGAVLLLVYFLQTRPRRRRLSAVSEVQGDERTSLVRGGSQRSGPVSQVSQWSILTFFSPADHFPIRILVRSVLGLPVICSPLTESRTQLPSATLALRIPLVTCRDPLSALHLDNQAHWAAFLLPAPEFLLRAEGDWENTFLPLFLSLSCCKLLCV